MGSRAKKKIIVMLILAKRSEIIIDIYILVYPTPAPLVDEDGRRFDRSYDLLRNRRVRNARVSRVLNYCWPKKPFGGDFRRVQD